MMKKIIMKGIVPDEWPLYLGNNVKKMTKNFLIKYFLNK